MIGETTAAAAAAASAVIVWKNYTGDAGLVCFFSSSVEKHYCGSLLLHIWWPMELFNKQIQTGTSASCAWKDCGKLLGHCVKGAPTGQCEGSTGTFLEQTFSCQTLKVRPPCWFWSLRLALGKFKRSLQSGSSFYTLPLRFSTAKRLPKFLFSLTVYQPFCSPVVVGYVLVKATGDPPPSL